MAEPADINVDELRRRARRRLVGAVVLALGVAVVVPMLLETDQKPLGEDVSVKIPPVDDSKFVNRLSDSRTKDAGKAAPRTGDDAAKAAPSGAAAPAERASRYDTRVPEPNCALEEWGSDTRRSRRAMPPSHPRPRARASKRQTARRLRRPRARLLHLRRPPQPRPQSLQRPRLLRTPGRPPRPRASPRTHPDPRPPHTTGSPCSSPRSPTTRARTRSPAA